MVIALGPRSSTSAPGKRKTSRFSAMMSVVSAGVAPASFCLFVLVFGRVPSRSCFCAVLFCFASVSLEQPTHCSLKRDIAATCFLSSFEFVVVTAAAAAATAATAVAPAVAAPAAVVARAPAAVAAFVPPLAYTAASVLLSPSAAPPTSVRFKTLVSAVRLIFCFITRGRQASRQVQRGVRPAWLIRANGIRPSFCSHMAGRFGGTAVAPTESITDFIPEKTIGSTAN